MEQVFVTVPIPLESLKRKFVEDIEFVIDYDNSKFKNKVFITYLCNLDLKCRIEVKDPSLNLELVEYYLRSTSLVNIPDLIDIVANLLLAFKGKHSFLAEDVSEFLEKNKDILETWVSRLESLILYTLFINDNARDLLKEFPEDDSAPLVGINFVHLIEHPLFPIIIEDVDMEKVKWNPVIFKDYIFSGNNLFKYFASKENPLFMAVLSASQTDDDRDLSIEPYLNEADGLCMEFMKRVGDV